MLGPVRVTVSGYLSKIFGGWLSRDVVTREVPVSGYFSKIFGGRSSRDVVTREVPGSRCFRNGQVLVLQRTHKRGTEGSLPSISETSRPFPFGNVGTTGVGVFRKKLRDRRLGRFGDHRTLSGWVGSGITEPSLVGLVQGAPNPLLF
jgi:hypothetical protein